MENTRHGVAKQICFLFFLASNIVDDLPGVVFDDHGVDDLDDGLAGWFGESFEGLEAAVEPGAVHTFSPPENNDRVAATYTFKYMIDPNNNIIETQMTDPNGNVRVVD